MTRLQFAVFVRDRLLARSDLATAARTAHANASAIPIVLEGASGRVVDLDLRGSVAVGLARIEAGASSPKAGRGRPRLGVVAREVTLLPRHWDWLSAQPGGASAALRRLVDQARRDNAPEDERRQVQEAVYRVATTLAGDRPGYEDAIRALFGGDMTAFDARIAAWPPDIAAYLRDLTAPLAGPS